MKHSLPELYSIIRSTGLPEPDGFPIPAILASIAFAEGGDPDAYVPHDPPRNPNAPPSSGLYQVHLAQWPEIFDAVQQVRISGMTQREKIVRQTMLVRPILVDALETSARAARILESRGFRVSRLTTALMMNATWQAGADNVLTWARTTRTGDARQIVEPARAVRVEGYLRHLAAAALGLAPAAAVGGGVLVLLGLGALAIWLWDS